MVKALGPSIGQTPRYLVVSTTKKKTLSEECNERHELACLKRNIQGGKWIGKDLIVIKIVLIVLFLGLIFC